jgi:hypothetical protein
MTRPAFIQPVGLERLGFRTEINPGWRRERQETPRGRFSSLAWRGVFAAPQNSQTRSFQG